MGAQRAGGLESFIAGAGQGLGGAGQGAVAGAAIGSVVPGIGTALGAGVGAGLGFVGGALSGIGRLEEAQEQRELSENQLALQAEALKQKLLLQLLQAARQKRLDDINIKRTLEADVASKRQTALGEALTASNLASQLRDRQFSLADLNRSLGRI